METPHMGGDKFFIYPDARERLIAKEKVIEGFVFFAEERLCPDWVGFVVGVGVVLLGDWNVVNISIGGVGC